jgi:hypothetical protein
MIADACETEIAVVVCPVLMARFPMLPYELYVTPEPPVRDPTVGKYFDS